MQELLSFWEVVLPKMRFRPAQALKMKKMQSFCKFMKAMLSFREVMLPKMRFRPAQTLKMKKLVLFSEFMKEMLPFWSCLGRHAGRERLQI